MTRRLHVQVTEEDITLGVRRDADRCPLARAAARASNGSRPGRLVQVSQLPAIAQAFVRLFDDDTVPRELLRPFEFDIDMEVQS